MDPITLTAIASTLVKTGPSLLRSIGSFFRDDKANTVNKLADLVDIAMGKPNPEQALNHALTSLSPQDLVQLKSIAGECEVELARIEANQATAIHQQTQATIQHGDDSQDPYVRATRPLMARASGYVTGLYILGMEGLAAFSYGQGAQWDLAMMMLSPLLTYMGLREVGKWRQGKAAGVGLLSSLGQLIPPAFKKGA
tara:strand:- start:7314 stop:7904 length:591 start_codon:yes stop_codon:yes gene_type:complete